MSLIGNELVLISMVKVRFRLGFGFIKRFKNESMCHTIKFTMIQKWGDIYRVVADSEIIYSGLF